MVSLHLLSNHPGVILDNCVRAAAASRPSGSFSHTCHVEYVKALIRGIDHGCQPASICPHRLTNPAVDVWSRLNGATEEATSGRTRKRSSPGTVSCHRTNATGYCTIRIKRRTFSTRSSPARCSPPPIRKITSWPYISRRSGSRSKVIPPPGTGKIGLRWPMVSRQPSRMSWQSSRLNGNRPP